MADLSNLGRGFLSRVQEDVTDHLDQEFNRGFDEAANLCIGILEQKINDLANKISPSTFLTEAEQLLLATLQQLKVETEDRLDHHERSQ